jgi:hypothetical protein
MIGLCQSAKGPILTTGLGGGGCACTYFLENGKMIFKSFRKNEIIHAHIYYLDT